MWLSAWTPLYMHEELLYLHLDSYCHSVPNSCQAYLFFSVITGVKVIRGCTCVGTVNFFFVPPPEERKNQTRKSENDFSEGFFFFPFFFLFFLLYLCPVTNLLSSHDTVWAWTSLQHHCEPVRWGLTMQRGSGCKRLVEMLLVFCSSSSRVKWRSLCWASGRTSRRTWRGSTTTSQTSGSSWSVATRPWRRYTHSQKHRFEAASNFNAALSSYLAVAEFQASSCWWLKFHNSSISRRLLPVAGMRPAFCICTMKCFLAAAWRQLGICLTSSVMCAAFALRGDRIVSLS